MPFALRYFSEFEKHETVTDLRINLASKLTLLKFLNTSVIFVVVHHDAKTWFTGGDLISDVFSVLIFAVGAPVLNCITAIAMMQL